MADRLFQRDFIQKLVLYAHSQEKRDAELLNARSLNEQERNLKTLQEYIEWSMEPTPKRMLAITFIVCVRGIFIAQSVLFNTILCLQYLFVFVVCLGPVGLIFFLSINPEKFIEFIWIPFNEFAWNVGVPFINHQCRVLLPLKMCILNEELDQYMFQPGLYVAQAVCRYIVK